MVLGDSHLGLDLQFGVQEHTILKALVHENYNINDNYHYNDIGLDFDLYKLNLTFFTRPSCAKNSCQAR